MHTLNHLHFFLHLQFRNKNVDHMLLHQYVLCLYLIQMRIAVILYHTSRSVLSRRERGGLLRYHVSDVLQKLTTF